MELPGVGDKLKEVLNQGEESIPVFVAKALLKLEMRNSVDSEIFL